MAYILHFAAIDRLLRPRQNNPSFGPGLDPDATCAEYEEGGIICIG